MIPNPTNRQRALVAMARLDRALLEAAQCDYGSRQALVVPLYGGIGARYPENGLTITASEVSRTLRRDRHAPAVFTLYSNGGSVAEGIRIHNELRDHRGPTMVKVPSRAHSAATLVLAGGAHRWAKPKARFLLHSPHIDRNKLPRNLDAKTLRRVANELDEDSAVMAALLHQACPGNLPGYFAERLVEGKEIGTWTARACGLLHEIEGLQPYHWRMMER